MKIILKSVLLFYLFSINISYAQKYRGEFAKTEFFVSGKRMNFFVNMFETKKQLLDFIEIKNREVIAEVGAGDGCNIGFLSMLYDSLTFYAQDINAKSLKQRTLQRNIYYYSKHRKTKQTNIFQRVIGTISSTNLPNGMFDKIILIDAYHDFDKKDDIIDDIAKKLKPNGKIIILDGFSFVGDTQICPDNGKHVLTTLPVEIKRFEKHGFYVTKMRSPDYRTHYGNGIIFERDKNKSDEFYKRKNEIDPLVIKSVRFWKKENASDSVIMKGITDSILQKIKEIINVYPEYEVWIKDNGLKHLRNKDYQSAINIFKANTKFFPNSYQAWYWLGFVYQENKQNKLAKECFKKSLEINSNNILAMKMIKGLDKS